MLLGALMDPSFSLWQTEPTGIVEHQARSQQAHQAAQDQWDAALASIPVQANQYHNGQPGSMPDPVTASHAAAYRMQTPSSLAPNFYQYPTPTPNWYNPAHQYQSYNHQILANARGSILSPETSSQPTTIDPSLVMPPPSQTYSQYGSQNIVTPPHLQLYSPPQQLQAQRAQLEQQQKYYSPQAFAYPPSSTSSSATPTPTQLPQLTPAVSEEAVNTVSSASATPNGVKSPTVVPTPSGPSLLERVRKLLTPRKLDNSPQRTAQALIDLLTNDDPVVDKETRVEILTRMRDNAPTDFFNVIGRNTPMVGCLQLWVKTAYKKEEFEDTLMPLLQVLDRTPLGVDQLASVSFGKVITAIKKNPPTSAIGDMATKIEGTWRSLLQAAQQKEAAAEAAVNASKKRKASEPAIKPGPTKKIALGPTPATTKLAPATTKLTATKPNTTTPVVKDVKSDTSFFSSKPKAKLPSFRRIQKPVESPAASTASPSGGATTNGVSDVAQPMDWDPFADALKSVRKGSPNVKPPDPSPSLASMVVDSKVEVKVSVVISAKTGKPKKIVRFAADAELEKIKYIEPAVYDDDGSGSGPSGVHGRSLADLQREEGSLLRHKMLEQVDWVAPSPIMNNGLVERGTDSTEKDVQAQREASTLAALYQGAPPDTPIEPPNLANLPMELSEAETKIMMPSPEVADITQNLLGGVHQTVMPPNVQDLMAKLAGAAGVGIPPVPAPPTAPAMPGNLADLLEQLKGSLPPPQPQPPTAPAADLYSSYGTPASTSNGGYDTNGYSSAAQPSSHDSYSNSHSYSGYGGGSGSGGQGSGYGDSGRSRGGPSGRGRGNKGIPASQNTRRPLCSFFVKGRCRYGEECDYSHDAAKLANHR